MILLLVGASERAIQLARAVTTVHAIDIRIATSSNRPDWVMTSTAGERAEAIRLYGLPSHRVIELRGLAGGTDLSQAALKTVVDRMVEMGPLPRSRPRRAESLAPGAIPLVTEWATWLAAEEARQRMAVHSAHLRSKQGTTIKGQVLIVVPDLRALGPLSGLLTRLSDQRHRVHVVVTNPPPDDLDLSSWEDRQWGLVVSGPSELSPSPWQPLRRGLRECLTGWSLLDAGGAEDAFETVMRGASPLGVTLARSRSLRMWPLRTLASRVATWIERAIPPELSLIGLVDDLKPDVMVVVPHRSVESIEVDFVRVARWLDVPSLLLPLRWDDLASSAAFRFDRPDVVAVWNDAQRHEIDSVGRRPGRVKITGAVLPSDVVADAEVVNRTEYCRKLDIDPARRIILVEAPSGSTRASVAAFQRWHRLAQSGPDPAVRDVSVVVWVEHPDDVPVWRRLKETEGISIARVGTDERRAPFRLNEALVTADVVVTATVTTTLEALARGKAVIVGLDGEDGTDAEVERLCRVYAPRFGWPTLARGPDEIVRSLSAVLGADAGTNQAVIRSRIVRVNDRENGTLGVHRLLNDLVMHELKGTAPIRPAAWRRLLVLLCAAAARRFDARRNRRPVEAGPLSSRA